MNLLKYELWKYIFLTVGYRKLFPYLITLKEKTLFRLSLNDQFLFLNLSREKINIETNFESDSISMYSKMTVCIRNYQENYSMYSKITKKMAKTNLSSRSPKQTK